MHDSYRIMNFLIYYNNEFELFFLKGSRGLSKKIECWTNDCGCVQSVTRKLLIEGITPDLKNSRHLPWVEKSARCIYSFSSMLYWSPFAMLYLKQMRSYKSNQSMKAVASEFQWLSWSRFRGNFEAYSEWRFKNFLDQLISGVRSAPLFRSNSTAFSSSIDRLGENPYATFIIITFIITTFITITFITITFIIITFTIITFTNLIFIYRSI